MERSEKHKEVDFLVQCFEKSQIALCTDYRGLTVAEITNLRRELKKAGAYGRVVKNTLARISAKKVLKDEPQSEVEKFLSLLDGPNLVVFSNEDPVAPTKVIANFLKTNDKLKVKGAFLDGKFVDKTGVEAVSKMPGREELIGMLLRLMNTPAQSLMRLMKEPGAQVARVVEAQRAKLEGAA